MVKNPLCLAEDWILWAQSVHKRILASNFHDAVSP